MTSTRDRWQRCAGCGAPYDVVLVWQGGLARCPYCGELLKPGSVRRVDADGQAFDLVRCPWCGHERPWMAVERAGTPEHVVDVYYRCEECQRPFVVAHDPTAMAQVALTDLDTRTLQRLAFYRWLYRGGTR